MSSKTTSSSSSAGTPAAAVTRKTTVETVKDTLESIVVAFILAFVFRAFILEAYVIPTGSMAVTLYGDQLTNTCSTCGYEYARGLSPEEAQFHAAGRSQSLELRCPNCATEVDQFSATQLRRRDSGDRIVVLKWAWALGKLAERAGLGPQRWDVTVFKDPRDGTTNFIKRLVGLPGEAIEIIDGDIYTASIEELNDKAPGLVDEMDNLRRDVFIYGQTGQSGGIPEDIRQRYEQINRRLLPHLRIQRKTPSSQAALWVNIYNNDFHPSIASNGRSLSQVLWSPTDTAAAGAWDTTNREISFQSDSPTPLSIRLSGKEINDFVAYNYGGLSPMRSARTDHPTGELRLHFTWLPESGNGGLSMRMNRDRDTFTAEIHRDGKVTLERQSSAITARGGKVQIGQTLLDRSLLSRQALDVEFTNVDYRVTLRIDGQVILASDDTQYAPDLEHAMALSQREGVPEPSQVTISAWDMHCRLRHVIVERDVYHRSVVQLEDGARDPAGRVVATNPFHRWPGWATAGYPLLLRPERTSQGKTYEGDYLMLGDNSPASKDSRLWWEIGPHLQNRGDEYQLGTVPGDQLVGMAFFVYWPAGYRLPGLGGIGLIPNFGRIRWIR